MNLNVGCGFDDWGDIRLNVSKYYHKLKVQLNIMADAQNIPFRDKVFQKTRAFHILEHLPNWRKAVDEWCRVTLDEIELEIPIEHSFSSRQMYSLINYILNILFAFLSFEPYAINSILSLPKRRKEHLWKIDPYRLLYELRKQGFNATIKIIERPFFTFLCYGRMSRRFPFNVSKKGPTFEFAYRIVAKSNA